MIREMKRIDLAQIVMIEKASFQDGCYSKEQLLYEYEENPFAKILVMDIDEEIVGFLIYMETFNSATVVQIATRPFNRHRGVATKLINEMIERLMKKGYGVIESVTLEVRENNQIAHQFYLKNGFKDVVVKKKYYENGDNAIYMMRVLL
ncbi:MAG: ribosomal protein S18-alanine N-acetyltransferase [Bacilli bacterium]|nr:ribosomal protein S18-alanine N-acetyltransferase [Bacilli bacterium]